MLIPSSIQMFPAGSNVFLGLCTARVEPHSFCIGETLFIFLWGNRPLADIVQSVQQVVQALPADTPWRPDPHSALRLDWIAQHLASREEWVLNTPSGRENYIVRKRLLPA